MFTKLTDLSTASVLEFISRDIQSRIDYSGMSVQISDSDRYVEIYLRRILDSQEVRQHSFALVDKEQTIQILMLISVRQSIFGTAHDAYCFYVGFNRTSDYLLSEFIDRLIHEKTINQWRRLRIACFSHDKHLLQILLLRSECKISWVNVKKYLSERTDSIDQSHIRKAENWDLRFITYWWRHAFELGMQHEKVSKEQMTEAADKQLAYVLNSRSSEFLILTNTSGAPIGFSAHEFNKKIEWLDVAETRIHDCFIVPGHRESGNSVKLTESVENRSVLRKNRIVGGTVAGQSESTIFAILRDIHKVGWSPHLYILQM